MSQYTSEEVRAVVEQLVRSTIRRPYDILGVRNTGETYADLQEVVASSLILQPSCVFYISSLSAQRCLEKVNAVETTLVSLLNAIAVCGRTTFPVRDLTSLVNAKTALFDLEGAVNSRTKSFENIELAPPFIRFNRNVERFLEQAGVNIKNNGSIVQTPQQARKSIPALMRELEAGVEDLKLRVGLLSLGVADFSSLNLPALAAKGVIQRARETLEARHVLLDAMGEEERLEVLRETVLELLATKAVVKKFGSFTGPSSSVSITGTGQPYSDETHLATPAGVDSTEAGPFALTAANNTVDFWLDREATVVLNSTVAGVSTGGFEAQLSGSGFLTTSIDIGSVVYPKSGANQNTRWVVTAFTDTTIDLVGETEWVDDPTVYVWGWVSPDATYKLIQSFSASLDGQVQEPFLISAGQTDEWRVDIDGTVYLIPLTAGAARTAQEVCDDINAVLSTTDYVAEPYYAPLKYQGKVETTSGVTTRFELPFSGSPPASSFTPLGVAVGDTVLVISGPNAGNYYTITAVDGAGQYVDCTLTTGSPTVDTIYDQVQLGDARRRVRVKYNGDESGILARSRITSSPLTTVQRETGKRFGFFGQLFSQCSPIDPSTLVNFLNQGNDQIFLKQAFTPTVSSFNARSEPANAQAVDLYRVSITGSVSAGLNPTVTTTDSLEGVEVGDVVVVRSGTNAGATITITSLTDTTVTGTASVSITAASDLSFEIGPDLNAQAGWRLDILDGPNQGTYTVDSIDGDIPWRLILREVLPLPRPGFDNSSFFTVDLGPNAIRFESTNTTVDSRISMYGLCQSLFFSTDELAVGTGTSPWFELPSTPRTLSQQDYLDTYASYYKEPDTSYTITSIERDLNVIGISPEMPTGESWTFADQDVPFARLRVKKTADYTTFSNQLKDWLELDVVQTLFFRNLNALINPLLVNTNPTAAEVGTALEEVEQLYERLNANGATRTGSTDTTLESILQSYSVDPIEEVDVMLRTLKERGADRALDLLLSCAFSDFFNATIDGASYSGRVQELIRQTARLDLPISKFGRNNTRAKRVRASYTDVDYEYNTTEQVSEIETVTDIEG